MKSRAGWLLIGIAYVSFVACGIPAGLLGVAYPSIRTSFGLSLDAVGTLLTAVMIGALLSGFSSGLLVARIGIGGVLLAAGVAASAGYVGYALAPAWWVMVVCGLLAGSAGAAIDTVLNLYFAANHSPRQINWLHACYGVGATLGPLAMTAFLEAGISWRWAYVAVGLLDVLLVLCFAITRGRWHGFREDVVLSKTVGARQGMPVWSSLSLPVVWLGVALFFLASGIEHSAGQWSYSLFTVGRGVAVATAGLWVSIYWGSLTVGRVLYGLVANHLPVDGSIRVSILGTLCGAALIWCRVSDVVSFVGLALMGLAFAPIFPLAQLRTHHRVGQRHAPNAIGFQTAGASLGHGLLPSGVGVLAERVSLEVVGPVLVVATAVMLLVHELMLLRHREPDVVRLPVR